MSYGVCVNASIHIKGKVLGMPTQSDAMLYYMPVLLSKTVSV